MTNARSARPLCLALLAIVLAIHFQTRLATQLARPIPEKHFYPSNYLVALSLLAGQGFKYLLPGDLDREGTLEATALRHKDDSGPAGPVMDFLSGQGRRSLSADEWARYLAAGPRALPITAGVVFPDAGWEASRVLDFRVAAVLWRIFGIDWDVLFAFYALLSTAACLMVFGITTRLTGSAWGGLLGAASFMASPLERHLGTWSIRDASPLWFTCLAILLLLTCAEPVSSKLATWLRWLAIGAGCMLGLGWRPDIYLLLPFAVAALTALLLAARTRWPQIALAVVLLLGGAAGVRAVIDWLGPTASERVVSGRATFHVGWYADNLRSNLFRTENVFQVRAADYLVFHQANYFRLRSNREAEPNVTLYDVAHADATRAMYWNMLRYHAYAWWTRHPTFLGSLARIDHARDPDPPIGAAASPSGGWLAHAGQRVLEAYLACMPWLFALGLSLGALRMRGRLATLILAIYFAYYAAVLLVVLPDQKHWAPLLLPVHVLSAAGCWYVLCGLRSWRRWSVGELVQRVRLPSLVACAVLLCWGAVGVFAHHVSRTQRRHFIDGILALARSTNEPARRPDASRLHTIRVQSGETGEPVGYLFMVRGARRSVDLFCLHAREGGDQESLYYSTRHELDANRDQFFFVNPVAGTRIGDFRNYELQVSVRGRAELLSVTKIDLSRWDVGLPLSLVFTEEDDPLGPWLRPFVTEAFGSLQEGESFVRGR